MFFVDPLGLGHRSLVGLAVFFVQLVGCVIRLLGFLMRPPGLLELLADLAIVAQRDLGHPHDRLAVLVEHALVAAAQQLETVGRSI